MSANHSDCPYAIRGDRVPVTGTRYTTYKKHKTQETHNWAIKNTYIRECQGIKTDIINWDRVIGTRH